MPEHSAPVSARPCPSCARLVPSRVDRCRCGYDLTAAAPRTPIIFEADEPASRQWIGPTLVILAIAIGAGAFIVRTSSTRDTPEDAPAPRPTAQRAPPAAAPATVVAPAPALDVPAGLF